MVGVNDGNDDDILLGMILGFKFFISVGGIVGVTVGITVGTVVGFCDVVGVSVGKHRSQVAGQFSAALVN